jgi:hypothetical protein
MKVFAVFDPYATLTRTPVLALLANVNPITVAVCPVGIVKLPIAESVVPTF